jgi:hypothetical protein
MMENVSPKIRVTAKVARDRLCRQNNFSSAHKLARETFREPPLAPV